MQYKSSHTTVYKKKLITVFETEIKIKKVIPLINTKFKIDKKHFGFIPWFVYRKFRKKTDKN